MNGSARSYDRKHHPPATTTTMATTTMAGKLPGGSKPRNNNLWAVIVDLEDLFKILAGVQEMQPVRTRSDRQCVSDRTFAAQEEI